MLTRKISPDKNRLQQNQKIFDIYNIYRLVLSLILLISFLFESSISALGIISPALYFQASIFYVGFNGIVLLRALIFKHQSLERTQFISIIIDILILAVISYTCGGVTSGMAHLIIVPIAAGSMLFRNRVSTFLAAIGTIAAIYSEFYLSFTLQLNNNDYVQAGLFGLTLFIISLSLQYLATRIRLNEVIAKQQAESIQSLQEINDQVIQRMQTGIVVADTFGHILNINSSAKKMLSGNYVVNKKIFKLPETLLLQLNSWRQNNSIKANPFRASKTSAQIQASFSYLNPETKSNILIFLEDHSLLSSRVQHLKLMSLGRLTASIAHEVRNPLGAISHATQLLNESTEIVEEDQRLLEIITTHSHRINSIIENILKLSRNKIGAPGLINLYEWLEQFITKFSNSYKEDIFIDLELESKDIMVRFNQSQLEQTMTNLCENGIRYSLEQTKQPHITVKVHINPVNENPVIDIIDEGKGVPRNQEEKIFEPFFTTQSSGVGLGLFICKEICEANQAHLTYLRDENNNSCFRINFAHPDRNIS